MRKLLTLFFALSSIALPQASRANTCDVVQLPAGFEAGDLQGMAPADGMKCIDLRFPQGQNLSTELVTGENVSISIPGYFDNRADRMFLGDLPGRLEIRVYQLMRATSPQPFVIRIRFEAPGNG